MAGKTGVELGFAADNAKAIGTDDAETGTVSFFFDIGFKLATLFPGFLSAGGYPAYGGPLRRDGSGCQDCRYSFGLERVTSVNSGRRK